MDEKIWFNSHWAMQQYTKNFYDSFFELHPEFNNLNYRYFYSLKSLLKIFFKILFMIQI